MQAVTDKQSLYFIAILPLPDIAKKVTELKEYMRDNFASSRALKSPAHITLFAPFFLDVSDEKALVLYVGEIAIRHRSFRLDLNGFKAFPPKVIYIASDYSYPLDELQEDVRAGVNAFVTQKVPDFEPDTRSFNPHMTIAYRDLTKENFLKAWPQFETRAFHESFIADHICVLRHDRQKWEVISTLPMKIGL
jgi:2'-5' RNA ligase